jgi:hypothetical protein
MTKFTSMINIAAALLVIATAAPAAAGKGSIIVHVPAADDEFKPPVFAFAPVTDTRALTVLEPPRRVWTDPFRPAPPSFYEDHK